MKIGGLRNRVEVYGKIEDENELGEKSYSYGVLKKIWAKIVVVNGTTQQFQGNTIRAEITHKIVIRSNALSEITNDMYFIYKGLRYDIKYYDPNYKHGDSIEIMCSLVVE